MTAAVAVVALVFLPRGPAYLRRFFTEREVAIAVTRVIRDDPTKIDESYSRRITRRDVYETFLNPRLYIVRLLA